MLVQTTKRDIMQGWKMQVPRMQVQVFRDGKRKYGKRKYRSAWVEYASTENISTYV